MLFKEVSMKSLLQTVAVTAALGLSAGAQAQAVLKFGYAVAKDSHYGVGTGVFCGEIEKGTQGRYKCQEFPNGSLGGEREMIESVQLGTLDLVNTSSGPLGNFVPEVKIFDIPFLFRDYDHARKVLDGKIGQDILQKFQSKGLVGLTWAENGFRHMTNNKHEIRTPADAAGLKMRTMENKVHMEGYKAFGILPTPMAFTELFTALQQGTVDGQENPIPVILAAKFSQVQKFLSLTGHVYSPASIIMNQGVFNKLSAADKTVFLEAAKVATTAQRKRINDDEARGIDQLRKDGVKVTEKVDGEAFRKAIAPAYAGYAKEFGADNIAAIQAVK
jgi:tripartite ATP-independent transporter DctP family solute receptor